ncbi:site-specific integrase [Clostridium sp. 19966]|uniref:site-specific integrase n=1 Tax=Clostridium sp. 19966 TaxID=2768166 RepID=UPI0028DDDF88|nr:site-specific integrase [Clostridium sp. 19966]MDT8715236.1 site-specific integrase [Clostridium sp. 19966]
MASLKHQFLTCIDRNFNESGSDKHSAKGGQHSGTEDTMGRVWSYAERKSLIDISSQLAVFCKENFGTKQIKDITASNIQDFLKSKADTCNRNSLENYVSRLNKIEILVNKTFETADVHWRGNIVAPQSNISMEGKIRNVFMERSDFNRILEFGKDSKSLAPIAVELAGICGFRASELEKLQLRDINFSNNTIHIHESKGGKSRDIEVTQEQMDRIKEIVQERGLTNPTDHIVGIKAESIDRWLNRACSSEELKLNKYSDAKSGIHAIRKMVATEKYEQFISEGYNKKEAIDKVSNFLGHGENRKDIAQAYIKNL